MVNRVFDASQIHAYPEDVQYAIEFENTLHRLESQLHNTDDATTIAKEMLVTAAEFYDGDWCGILEIDLTLGAWTPLWWFNRKTGGMTPTRFLELEDAEPLQRWIMCMRQGLPIIVEDTESVRNTYPGEYDVYQRLDAQSIIAVPFWKNPTGFLLVRNPKKYQKHSSLLQMLAYVAVATINEKKLTDRTKQAFSPANIQRDTDVIINLFGELEIYTSQGVLTERDLNSSKLSSLLVYLLLQKGRSVPPRVIADVLWPDEESENPGGKIKTLAYRLQGAFSIISDHRLIVSGTHGYQLNPELNVMTDYEQFDHYRSDAQNTPSSTNSSSAKIELLKKAVALYRGSLFASSASEHWLMPTEVQYRLKYNGVINELLKELMADRHYSGIQEYASKALQIDPRNTDAYYWLIAALHQLGSPEIAKSELRMAQRLLDESDYEDLLSRLKNFTAKKNGLIHFGM